MFNRTIQNTIISVSKMLIAFSFCETCAKSYTKLFYTNCIHFWWDIYSIMYYFSTNFVYTGVCYKKTSIGSFVYDHWPLINCIQENLLSGFLVILKRMLLKKHASSVLQGNVQSSTILYYATHVNPLETWVICPWSTLYNTSNE